MGKQKQPAKVPQIHTTQSDLYVNNRPGGLNTQCQLHVNPYTHCGPWLSRTAAFRMTYGPPCHRAKAKVAGRYLAEGRGVRATNPCTCTAPSRFRSSHSEGARVLHWTSFSARFMCLPSTYTTHAFWHPFTNAPFEASFGSCTSRDLVGNCRIHHIP
jgi:hypothetical protein